jgi:hypothetical protein
MTHRWLVRALERIPEERLLEALQEARCQKAARLLAATAPLLAENDPLPALRIAQSTLEDWAESDKTKLQFAEEVMDIRRRLVAFRETS